MSLRAIDLAHAADPEAGQNLVRAEASAGCQRHESRLILAMKWLAAQARRRHLLNWASSLPQRLPTDPRTAKREEGLVDVGPFVVTDAQTAELIQPRKRPLDNPAPPPQAAAVFGAAHRQQRQNVTRAQAVPDGR